MHQLHIPTQMSTVQARPLMSLNTVVQLNQMLSSQAAGTGVTVQLHMDTPLKHNRISAGGGTLLKQHAALDDASPATW
jgi:hypothetical protein